MRTAAAKYISMTKLTIVATDAADFAKKFEALTAGAQVYHPTHFAAVWEKGGVVRVGKRFYEIDTTKPKAAKPKAAKK